MTDLLAGQADAVLYVNPTELLKIDRDPRFRAYHTIDPENLSALVFNLRRLPFDDARVRRAVALAIDRRTLFASMNLPSGLPIVDGPTDFDRYLAGEVPEPIPHDPGAAARLLEAAGWRDVDGDGVREKAGRPLAFEVLTSEWQQASRAAVLLQSQLVRVGARVEIVPLELQVERERVLAGRFDAAVTMVVGPLDARVLFGPDSPLGYRSERGAALVERIEMALDRDERSRLQAELTEVLRADMPAVFLAPAVWSFAAHRRVQGLSSPWRADPVQWADRLWIENEPR